jgi:hypothetical protein
MYKETNKIFREDPISRNQSDQSFSFLNSKEFNYPATGKSIEEGVKSFDKHKFSNKVITVINKNGQTEFI